jgi:hypothetical protein
MHVVLCASHDGENTLTQVLLLSAVPSWSDFVRPTEDDFREVHKRGIQQLHSKRVAHLIDEYPKDVRILYLSIGPVSQDVAKRYEKAVSASGIRGVYSKYRRLIECHRDLCVQGIVQRPYVYVAIATPTKVHLETRASAYEKRLQEMSSPDDDNKDVKMKKEEEDQESSSQEEGEEENMTLLKHLAAMCGEAEAFIEPILEQADQNITTENLRGLSETDQTQVLTDLDEECRHLEAMSDIMQGYAIQLRAIRRRALLVHQSIKDPKPWYVQFFKSCSSVFSEMCKGVKQGMTGVKTIMDDMESEFVCPIFDKAHSIVRDISVWTKDLQTTWTLTLDKMTLTTAKGFTADGNGTVTMQFNPISMTSSIQWNLTASNVKRVFSLPKGDNEDEQKIPSSERHIKDFKATTDYVDARIRKMFKSRENEDEKIMWTTTHDVLQGFAKNKVHKLPSPVRLVLAFAALHMHTGMAFTQRKNVDAGATDAGQALALSVKRTFHDFQAEPEGSSYISQRAEAELKKTAKACIDSEASTGKGTKKKEKKSEMEYQPGDSDKEDPEKESDDSEDEENEEEESEEDEEEEDEEEGNDDEDKRRFKEQAKKDKAADAKKRAELKKRKLAKPPSSSDEEEDEDDREKEKPNGKSSPKKKQKTEVKEDTNGVQEVVDLDKDD